MIKDLYSFERKGIRPALPRRAIFVFAHEINSALFSSIASLYQDFENAFLKPISDQSAHFAQWAGDVHKFGVHITLRGVSPVKEERVGEWFTAIREVACQFTQIHLENSRLSTDSRFPCRVKITFDGPDREKLRLADISATLARSVSPMIKWRHVSIFELHEARSILNSMIQYDQKKKKEQLQILDEITSEVKASKLPPMPDTPEYRLPLLVPLWRDKTMKDALFEVGDPFAIHLEPHISIIAAVPPQEKIAMIIKQIEVEFPQLVGQRIQIDQIYAMVENMTSHVLVNEFDPRIRDRKKIQMPRWEIEAAFPLAR